MMTKEISEDDARLIVGSALLGLVLLIPVSAINRGLCLMLMWRWFVAPFGVSPLTFVHAVGLGLLLAMVTTRAASKKSADVKGVVAAFVLPWIFVLLGWPISAMM